MMTEPKWLARLPIVGKDVRVLLKTGGYLHSPNARVRCDLVQLHIETISQLTVPGQYPYISHTAELPLALILIIQFTDENGDTRSIKSPSVESVIDIESKKLQLITFKDQNDEKKVLQHYVGMSSF